MVAVKVMRTSDNDNDDATPQQRDDADNADDANDDADGEGRRRTNDATAWRWWGVVLTASPDGRRGARLHLAATAPCRRDDDDGC